MCFVETWLNDDIKTAELEIYFNNYKVHRMDRELNKGGGVLILVSKKFESNIENLLYQPYIGIYACINKFT